MRIERKQIVIGAVIAGMLGAFAVGLYAPMQKSIRGIKAMRSAKAIMERTTKTEFAQLPDLKLELAALEVKVGNYDNRIPSERNLGPFLQQIADAMDKHSMRDQIVEPLEEARLGGLVCVPIRMQCTGTIAQVFEFFKSLGSFERVIRIEGLEIKTAKEEGFVTMAARTNIYYEPERGKKLQ